VGLATLFAIHWLPLATTGYLATWLPGDLATWRPTGDLLATSADDLVTRGSQDHSDVRGFLLRTRNVCHNPTQPKHVSWLKRPCCVIVLFPWWGAKFARPFRSGLESPPQVEH
jgi:hypothetical protein